MRKEIAAQRKRFPKRETRNNSFSGEGSRVARKALARTALRSAYHS
jgi:hypothetical protein